MKIGIIVQVLLFLGITVHAQQKVITGKVTSVEDGLGLPGVSVVVTGSTNGTITDVEGNFELKISNDTKSLTFSFIGMETQVITIDQGIVYNISMKPTLFGVEEVVITALGISKQKKSLGYTVSEIKGSEVTAVRDVNMLNSLSGKSAGVIISRSSGDPDASVRVVIRGNNSLKGNNQPLYVVDGVPISNNSFGETTASADGVDVGQGFEKGSGIGDINPEDIESISILKGPNASALYGSRAANGVIVITTKKGSKREGLGVTISSNTTFDRLYDQRKYQNTFGFGNNGISPVNDDGMLQFPSQLEGSWGSKMEGQPFIDWDGVVRNYNPQPDNYNDFFRTGITSINTIAVSGGSDKAVYRLSFTNLANRGITPNSNFGRKTIDIKGGLNLTPKIKIETKVTYIMNEAKNRNYQADGHSVSRNYIHMPRSVSDASLRDYEDDEGNQKVWRNHDRQSNPYWVAYKDINKDRRDRVLGTFTLNYDITPALHFTTRYGTDMYYYKFRNIIATGELTRLGRYGQLYEGTQFSRENNFDYLFSYNKHVTDKISISATFGGNRYSNHYESFSGRVTRSSTPNFYNLSYNIDPIIAWTVVSEKITESLYGSAQIEYNKFLYFDVTAREDWSSTILDPYFYSSYTGSFLFNELLHIDERYLSFGKLRASWARVGNDTDPYRLEGVFYSNSSYDGNPRTTIGTMLQGGNDLKPEITESYEFGSELKFFFNRVSLDFTLYKSSSYNQILDASIPTSSSYTTAVINAGEIQNKGIELQLFVQPINHDKGFTWNSTFNFSKNKSEVVSLTPGLNSLVLANHWNLTVEAIPGQPYGDLIGVEIQRDENGNKLIGSDGLYVRGERVVLGNYNPDWIAGWSNEFKYKNFSLSCLVDFRIGGNIYSATNHYGFEKGTFVETLEGREGWYASETARKEQGVTSANWVPTGGYLAEGVLADGTPNTKYMNPELYFGQFARWGSEIHEPYVFDATYIKLREIYLGYKLPESLLKRWKILSAEVALTCRNPWIIYKKAPNIDPESVYNSTNAQGVEYAAMPTIRSYGIGLKLDF